MKSKYNGYTIQEIENMPFKGWIKEHIQEYINNCKRVVECQETGLNVHEIEMLKNSNFDLTVFYMNLNK